MANGRNRFESCQDAVLGGMNFISGIASLPGNFENYGSFLVCCFALIGTTSRDAKLRLRAREQARHLVRRWQTAHSQVGADATPDDILVFVLGRYAAKRLRLREAVSSEHIGTAAGRFTARDFLGFSPDIEPPPVDLPYSCNCGLENARGRKFCRQCRRRLEIQSRYRVWMDALANTYISQRCGVLLGARYEEVLKWLPLMRPYPLDNDLVRDALYAVTHLVYTLNDYGTYKLSRSWLPEEFAFLRDNVGMAIAIEDQELLGELLDSLKAFGLPDDHLLIRRGTKYLLARQNQDGSWGDPDEENIRRRCHTTWTVIDGLRSYAWRGERLSIPRVHRMLAQCGQPTHS